jgi:hypothetical protein
MTINWNKYLLDQISLKFYYRKYSQLPLQPSYFHVPLLLPSLIKNLPSSFRDFARFIKVNRIPSSILSYGGELPAISLLIVVAHKDFENLKLCIAQILKHSLNPISKVEIVVPESDLASCRKILEQIQLQIPISLINEDEVINVQLREKMKSKLKHKYGWALQQLLTLHMVMRSDCCGVLAVDADTFVLRDQVWLNDKFTQVLFQSPEFHVPYYKVINKVFPKLDTISYSHITHHMLFQPELLREFLTKNGYVDSADVMIQVLESFDKLQESPFCIEFEPYAQFLHDSHKDRFELRRFSNSNFSTKENNVSITELIQSLDNHNFYNSINFHSWNN